MYHWNTDTKQANIKQQLFGNTMHKRHPKIAGWYSAWYTVVDVLQGPTVKICTGPSAGIEVIEIMILLCYLKAFSDTQYLWTVQPSLYSLQRSSILRFLQVLYFRPLISSQLRKTHHHYIRLMISLPWIYF